MKNTAIAVLASVLAIFSAALGAAIAQQIRAEGSVNLTPFEARGIRLSTIYRVDGAFADEHGVAVPASFTLAAPRRPGQKIQAQAKPSGGGPIKIYFTSDDGEGRIFSSLQIVTYSLKTDDLQKRLQVGDHFAIELLKKLGPNDDTRLNVRRAIKIGGLPASEVIGNFVNKDGDRLIARVVALAKPDTGDGIIGIVVGHPRQGHIKKVDDILETSASLAFDTVTFE
ncbi:MAG: hypothetical protein Tsb0019_20810 [Roseibium sp.]